MSETVLITGCSSGIGRVAAHAFLADGWTVYATARNVEALADLEAAGARTARLDVTADADVERVVDRILEEQGRLDCLINNAGFGQLGPVEDVPIEKVLEQYDVNTVGPQRLIRAVLPHMRAQGSGTIVNVTSITDRFPIAGMGAYNGSKSALATVSETLRQEVRDFGIDVVVIEPTVVSTALYDRIREELVDVDHDTAYTDLYELHELLHTVKSGGLGIASPEDVARAMLEAANSDDPRRRYTVGWTGKVAALVASVVPEPWRTPLLAAGVRAATSRPGKRLLQWWFTRNHRADRPDLSESAATERRRQRRRR
ncbi:SDR family oxidoreductase [Halopiger aswanensis]|uniref:NADP-dependent 3-hydroxy acid dehydrogenase YdfG n=1 Tax=Halopiger aswanensis TaxID=148449 RepID=A0A419WI42_9EURY|nr:SDR family oxidoreductase [Halopiger aswanensis]RKD95083.1 NADP-dependent 3-hydroxy acid dehydrogenase YdfG [Halopiger aswanensis]